MKLQNIIATLAITFLLLSYNSFSGDTKEVNIQTNLHCGSCASKIEKGLKKSSGVVSAKSDVESKVVTVKYDADKTDEAKITKAIAKMGYEADVVKSDAKKCCSDSKTLKSSGKDCCDTKATKSAPAK